MKWRSLALEGGSLPRLSASAPSTVKWGDHGAAPLSWELSGHLWIKQAPFYQHPSSAWLRRSWPSGLTLQPLGIPIYDQGTKLTKGKHAVSGRSVFIFSYQIAFLSQKCKISGSVMHFPSRSWNWMNVASHVNSFPHQLFSELERLGRWALRPRKDTWSCLNLRIFHIKQVRSWNFYFWF